MKPKMKLAEINAPAQKSYFAITPGVLVIASTLIVLIAMPELWYFVLPAGLIGIAAIFIVRMTNREEGAEGALAGERPEIDIAKIKVGGGVAGAIFTLGSMWIFLTGIPALWYFLALAIAVGAGIAVALRFTDPAR